MKFKKVLYLLLCITLLVSVCSCNENKEPTDSTDKETYVQPAGEWVLLSATLNGADATSKFRSYTVSFSDGKMRVYIDLGGIVTTRNNSSFSVNGAKLTETEAFMGETFSYTLGKENITTTFTDGDDVYNITLKKKTIDVVTQTAVDFEGVLFGQPITETKKFNYCPAILVEEDENGQEVMNIWYCTNKQSGIIMDHIGYRTGVQQPDGKWLFSEETIVIAPTPDTWDSRHTCDPAVIKGNFKMGGETYNYLMAYLGCTTEDYQKNETGIAVAKKVGGPWVKVDKLNPIVPWYDNGDIAVEEAKYQSLQGTKSIYWGTGMPALMSIDQSGEILLFYVSTKQGIGVQRWDLSDLDNPVCKYTTSVTSRNVTNSQGVKMNLGIPDFAYDPVKGRLYCASVTNERRPADVTLTRVNSHSGLFYVDGIKDMEALSSILQSGDYSWNVVDYVGPETTGWNRNHNPGLVRNSYGYIPDSNKVGMVVSTGCNDQNNENIFTYRLFGHWFDID